MACFWKNIEVLWGYKISCEKYKIYGPISSAQTKLFDFVFIKNFSTLTLNFPKKNRKSSKAEMTSHVLVKYQGRLIFGMRIRKMQNLSDFWIYWKQYVRNTSETLEVLMVQEIRWKLRKKLLNPHAPVA